MTIAKAVVLEAKVSQVNELTKRPSRPGEVEILEDESRDSTGLSVAGDAEPRTGAGVRRIEPRGERVLRVGRVSERKQDGNVWVREGNSDEDGENDRSRETNFVGQHF